MRFSAIFVALLPALALAGPVQYVRDSVLDERSGPGAMLFKNQGLDGGVVPQYQISIGTDFCVNLDNVYGGWENAVRSLEVYKGFTCCFHVDYSCPATDAHFGLGTATAAIVRKTLAQTWDKKIKSVFCEEISANQKSACALPPIM